MVQTVPTFDNEKHGQRLKNPLLIHHIIRDICKKSPGHKNIKFDFCGAHLNNPNCSSPLERKRKSESEVLGLDSSLMARNL